MGYTMNLVGEQYFHLAIADADEGDLVTIAHEVGNPADDEALVVKHDRSGRTLGYLPADSFLHRIAFDEGGSATAEIERIVDYSGVLNVKIYVELEHGVPVPSVSYSEQAVIMPERRKTAAAPPIPATEPASLNDLRVSRPEADDASPQREWLLYLFPVAVLALLAVGMFR